MEEASVQTLRQELGQLREALTKQEEDAQSYLEQIKRLQADFENWRRRVSQEKLQVIENASASLIEKLMPVLDHFEIALKTANASVDPAFAEGMNLIYRQILDLLKEQGLSPIDSANRIFDPNYHEALAYEDRAEGEDHKIIEEMRKGYLFKGKVLRPSLVKVAKVPARAADSKDSGG